jgi:hypothetical protein
LRVDVESLEHVEHRSVLAAHQTQQQMLRSHAAAGQTCSFLTRKGEDFRYL